MSRTHEADLQLARCNSCHYQGPQSSFPLRHDRDGGDWETCPTCKSDDVEAVSARDEAAARTLAENDAAAARKARIAEHGEELVALITVGEDIVSGLEAEADNAGINCEEARAWWTAASELLAKIEGKP